MSLTSLDLCISKVYTHWVDDLFLHRGQQFIWNSEKAAANIVKHGIRFTYACDVFFDRFVTRADAGVEEEAREAAIGLSADWKLLVVVHIVRQDDWIRIISAREATMKERRAHENSDGKN